MVINILFCSNYAVLLFIIPVTQYSIKVVYPCRLNLIPIIRNVLIINYNL